MKKKRVNRNTKQKNKTKRKNTRRMDNRRGNTKRNIKKRKTRRMDNRRGNTKRNTKRRQRGGMFLPPLPVLAAFNALTGRNARDFGNPEAATPATPATAPAPVAPEPAPAPAPEPAPEPITINFLNKFFDVTVGGVGPSAQLGYEYKLKGDLQLISAHGRVLPTYTVVPEGITLYLLVRAGLLVHHYRESRARPGSENFGRGVQGREDENNYISAYSPGSIIQEHFLNFNPLYSNVISQSEILDADGIKYTPRGLLKWKLRKGGRDYKDGFICKHGNEDCLKKAMEYLLGAVSYVKRILKLNQIRREDLWRELSIMNKEELLDFAFTWTSPSSSEKEEMKKMKKYDIKLRIISEYNYEGESIKYKELLKYIEKHLDKFYDDNLEQIYTKEELFSTVGMTGQGGGFYLRMVLNKIAEVMKTDDSISGDWFCTFCRSGEPLDIDTLLACQEKYFEPLPRDFFNEDIQFKGVSDKLRRESSLASKSETANFKGTVDALQGYCQGLDAGTEIPGLLSLSGLTSVITATREVKDKLNDIHTRLNNGEPVSLLPQEVCFIFQLKNHLQKQGLM